MKGPRFNKKSTAERAAKLRRRNAKHLLLIAWAKKQPRTKNNKLFAGGKGVAAHLRIPKGNQRIVDCLVALGEAEGLGL